MEGLTSPWGLRKRYYTQSFRAHDDDDDDDDDGDEYRSGLVAAYNPLSVLERSGYSD